MRQATAVTDSHSRIRPNARWPAYGQIRGWVLLSNLEPAGRTPNDAGRSLEPGFFALGAGVVTICERKHFTGQVDAYIGELAVASDLGRRGIATQLVNAAEVWAARRGLAFVTLETGAANHPARAFYAQRGYHDEDIRLTKALT